MSNFDIDEKSVSSDLYYTTAIKTDGSLWMLGSNDFGQLGDGTTTDRTFPVKVMDSVVSVSVGTLHTIAIKTDGSLWAWGSNNNGQLGDGITTNRTTLIKIMDDVMIPVSLLQ